MSLLMKALEKAAKEREETEAERTPATVSTNAAAEARSELSLEPLPAAGGPAREPAGVPREPGLAPRRPGRRAGEASLAAAADAAQAANMLRAGQRASGGGVGAYLRDHPIVVFGALASLFLIGYGLYVYLQMTNPGMFIAQTRPTQPAQITPPPAAPPVASGGGAASAQQPLSTALLLPPRTDASGRENPTPQPPGVTAGTATTGPAGARAAAAEAGVAGTTPAGPPATGTTTSNAAPAAPAAPPVPARSAPREDIRVARGGAAPTLNPVLSGAYQALESGNLDSSERLYNQVLKGEPGNVDALLGGAAVAAQKGDSDTAARNYMKVLQVDPGNTLAQAGLIGMVGRADPLAAETRVKQLIARDPSAYLYFTLGNVYVDQNRWPDAQQAYFQAHHLQPDNPDYAYNLAVGLEHVGQPKLALEFYRRATQLAGAKGRANFSTGAALERISKLERVVE